MSPEQRHTCAEMREVRARQRMRRAEFAEAIDVPLAELAQYERARAPWPVARMQHAARSLESWAERRYERETGRPHLERSTL